MICMCGTNMIHEICNLFMRCVWACACACACVYKNYNNFNKMIIISSSLILLVQAVPSCRYNDDN